MTKNKEYLTYIKKRMTEHLKPLGLTPNSSKTLWVDDNGFFITYVEIAPWYDLGVCFNVAVQFLWNKCDYSAFGYYCPDSRIIIDETSSLGGCIMFEQSGWQNNVERTLEEAKKKISEYRELRNIDVLINRLENRCDLFAIQNPDYRLRDIDRALALAVKGELNSTKEILEYIIKVVDKNFLDEFVEYLNALNDGTTLNKIIQTIQRQRVLFGKKWKMLSKKSFDFFDI